MMFSYRYVKSKPKYLTRIHLRLVSLLLIFSGFLILFWTAWPIIAFNLNAEQILSYTISPIGDAEINKLTSVSEVAGQQAVDLTNPNLWFPVSPQKKVNTPVNSYLISIPKLKINQALVTIAGDDLNKSLIHYGGTALPGEYGTTVIFGHSTLPQFYNPQSYKSIFSTLPTLKIGDDFWITYDKLTFHYQIEEMLITEPTDLTPLAQKFDDSHITLITCVPPGTYWKRLNVRARLVKI